MRSGKSYVFILFLIRTGSQACPKTFDLVQFLVYISFLFFSSPKYVNICRRSLCVCTNWRKSVLWGPFSLLASSLIAFPIIRFLNFTLWFSNLSEILIKATDLCHFQRHMTQEAKCTEYVVICDCVNSQTWIFLAFNLVSCIRSPHMILELGPLWYSGLILFQIVFLLAQSWIVFSIFLCS